MNIETVKRQKGKRYRATVYVNGKKMRSTLFVRVVDAQLWAERVKQGYSVEVIPTFGVAAQNWMDGHSRLHNKPGTINRNLDFQKELLPVFGNKKLSQISAQDIERHLRSLKERGLSNNSLRLRVSFTRSVYNWHLKRGLQVFNPCLAIRSFKSDDVAVAHWSREQSETFLAFTGRKYAQQKRWVYILYLCALNTGLRWGEIIGLDWSHVDFERRQIAIVQIFDSALGAIRSATKSGRFRYVGINNALYEQLLQAKGKSTSGLVFKALNENPVDRRNFMTRHFYRDMTAAVVPRIHFHALRHTYATLFMASNGNIFDLQKLLGHSTLSMTDRYAHFAPSHASQRANVVNLGLTGRLKIVEEQAPETGVG